VLAALWSVIPGGPARADIDIQINGVDGELRRMPRDDDFSR
jgi:hypothetical protein